MNTKKLLPILLLVIMAFAAIVIKRWNNSAESPEIKSTTTVIKERGGKAASNSTRRRKDDNVKFNKDITKLFFTKHAKCRMKCRQITQKEVKEILAEGSINYKKSNLNDPKGATYALEGNTDDGQHVRIIVAPKQQHLSIVTVIDLENEYQCNCN